MKKYLVLLSFALITTVALGQSNYQDVVHLKKGSGSQSGYKGIVELGYQIGAGDYSTDNYKLNIINGYRINPHFSLGFGTGLRYYLDEYTALIPVFADFRVNFIDNNVSPYLSLDVGYSFDVMNIEGAGFLLNPTVGASVKISEESALIVGLGYEIQKMEVHSNHSQYVASHVNSYVGPSVKTRNRGAISLSIGISF